MKWISVMDRLPKPNECVLAWGISEPGEKKREVRACKYECWDNTAYGGKKGATFSLLSSGCGCCDRPLEDVQHWMLLPEPPNE